MKIAIVDDEKAHAELLEKYARAWAEGRRLRLGARLFAIAEAFLFAWAEDQNFDALLLDIQMGGQSGMELARELRRGGHRIPVVFVTGYPDYVGEGYDVEALHYLMKPVSREKLFACMDRACARAGEEPGILVETADGTLRLRQCDVLYIEAFAHESEITTTDKTIRVRRSIGDIWDALDALRFVRPRRCYIVGLHAIRQIGRAELTLDSGVRLPVSRRKYDEINRAFIAFFRGDGT